MKKLVVGISALTVVVLVLAGLLFSQSQIFKDQMIAWQHPLDPKVEKLADQAGLSSQAKFLLQISLAKVENSSKTAVTDEKLAGLSGSYQNKKIIIYTTDNQNSSNVEALTAAHEMLHAVYDRLSAGAKSKVDTELKDFVVNTNEPYSELFARTGTTNENLPADLAAAYKPYFSDSQKLQAVINSQAVKDQLTAWQNPLDSEITALANQAGLNDQGKFLLAASKTELQGSNTFKPGLTSDDSQTIIEGYYQAQRIYVYDVTNPKVSGMMAVTAAHEMLHAAYERLSSKDKASVDAQIQAYIPHIKNQDIKDMMTYYAKAEPGQELNELHSMLATEEPNLPAGLEAYYKRYFTNRAAVIAVDEQESAIFTGLKNQIDALQQKMTAESADITAKEASYDTAVNQLNADIAAYNAGQSSTTYDALIAQQNALEGLSATINAEIDQYNSEVPQMNALGGQANSLSSSIGVSAGGSNGQ